MKIKIIIITFLLLTSLGCSQKEEIKTTNQNINTPPSNYCQDEVLLNQLTSGAPLILEQCLTLNLNGNTLDEIVLLEVNYDELYKNGKVTVFKYNLNNQEWEKFWESQYDVDAQMTLQKSDLNNDFQEELLINQYLGASGSAINYNIYTEKDGELQATQFEKAYENQDKYLEEGEVGASQFDAKFEGNYLIESFSTYKELDPQCCPNGRGVSIYYEMLEDGTIHEVQVISEKIEVEY